MMDPLPNTEKLDQHLAGLYEGQATAVRMVLRHRVSNIFGPAATGKSHTIAVLILYLIVIKSCVLVCAPTNVAKDSIFERVSVDCSSLCCSCLGRTPSPLCCSCRGLASSSLCRSPLRHRRRAGASPSSTSISQSQRTLTCILTSCPLAQSCPHLYLA